MESKASVDQVRMSARKMRLYTLGDHLRLLVRVTLNRQVLTRRESCTIWYDGRR